MISTCIHTYVHRRFRYGLTWYSSIPLHYTTTYYRLYTIPYTTQVFISIQVNWRSDSSTWVEEVGGWSTEHDFFLLTNKQTNEQTNERTNKRTSKQTNEQTKYAPFLIKLRIMNHFQGYAHPLLTFTCWYGAYNSLFVVYKWRQICGRQSHRLQRRSKTTKYLIE